MTSFLGGRRLVVISAADGNSGVADYARSLQDGLAGCVTDLVRIRTGGPGRESVADVRRARAEVRRAITTAPNGAIVHAELSAGSLGPFWALAAVPPTVASTATLHDAPLGVWFPARTATLARSRVLNHGLHYPSRPLTRRLEGGVYRGRSLVALSDVGRRRVIAAFPGSTVHMIPMLVEDRPQLPPPSHRPRAIGLFGFVYRGKGFEHLASLRRRLDPSIAVRVAGRGTERLPRLEGIEILGAVEGAAEDAFFGSVQALVLPYDERHFYGPMVPGSGTAARALAYATPLVVSRYGALAEFSAAQGAVVVDTSEGRTFPAAAADEIVRLLDDPRRCDELGRAAAATAQQRSVAATVRRHLEIWGHLVGAT